MSRQAGTGGTAQPGVWDPDAGVPATAELVRAALTLGRDPASAAERGRPALAGLLRRELEARDTVPADQLAGAHGYTDTSDLDAVLQATVTGLLVGKVAVEDDDPRGRWEAIAYAALDAIGRTDDAITVDEVAAVLAVVSMVAAPLQEVFAHAGGIEPQRSWITVGAIAAGVGVGLLSGAREEERLLPIVGLLASCSAATGPAAFGGPAEAYLVGRAAGNAVLGARLVATGFTVNPRSLEAPRGLVRAMTGTVPTEAAVRELRALADRGLDPHDRGGRSADRRPWRLAREAGVAQQEEQR